MRIRYNGSGRRRLGDLVWDRENGYVVDVSAEVAAALLTYPYPQFSLDESEPLLELGCILGFQVAELALAGVGSVEELAELDDAGAEEVAAELGVEPPLVGWWIDQARMLLGLDNEETAKVTTFVEILHNSGGE